MKKIVAVVGTQFGDEGKGKITHYFSEKADVVVRFQGGDNAGHTIKFLGNTYALHVIPSGIFNNNIKNVIGNGVVLNPKTFVKEVTTLKSLGFKCENLFISDRCHIIFDHHIELDGLNEKSLGKNLIGTTKKGIGPTYTDKASRCGIRACDFISSEFEEIYKDTIKLKNEQIKRLGGNVIDVEESLKEYLLLKDTIKPYVTDTHALLQTAVENNQKILFEGAQGAMLDVDFGTYPFVTSSNTTSGGICTGSGIGPTHITDIIGITKAYSSRVGSGAFPTELFDEVGDYIRETAHEYGTTTKRPRRIGWLDLVLLKYTTSINGCTGISLMLLDILSGLKEIKVCTKYLLDGKEYNTIPPRAVDFNKCVPVYETLKGWNCDISNVTSFDDLPLNCKKYIQFIENTIKVPVVIVSVGPDKTQTIIRKEIF